MVVTWAPNASLFWLLPTHPCRHEHGELQTQFNGTILPATRNQQTKAVSDGSKRGGSGRTLLAILWKTQPRGSLVKQTRISSGCLRERRSTPLAPEHGHVQRCRRSGTRGARSGGRQRAHRCCRRHRAQGDCRPCRPAARPRCGAQGMGRHSRPDNPRHPRRAPQCHQARQARQRDRAVDGGEMAARRSTTALSCGS